MKKDSVMTGASPPAEPIVRIRGLRKSFGNHVVLNGIDFDVLPSQVVVVIGPSGSGKSTFLRCCNGLEQPEGGTVEICGRTLVQDGRMLPDGLYTWRITARPATTVESTTVPEAA